MKLGLFTMNPPGCMRADVLAREIEARGLDSFWVGEHSHIPVKGTPYPAGGELPDPYKTMPDMFVWLTAAAMATTRIKLGTGVLLPLERNHFHTAKACATLDIIAGGRLIVGVGVGWNEVEYQNHSSIPWRRRYVALRENVAVLRQLWAEQEPSFQGDFIRFDPVWSFPKPVQRPGPKIAVGAAKKLGVAHTAEWGDYWYPLVDSFRDPVEAVNRFGEACKEKGRDVPIIFSSIRPKSYDTLAQYRDLGVSETVFNPQVDEADHAAVLRMLDSLAELRHKLAA